MAWDETTSWLEGQANERLYQRLLDDSMDAPSRNSRRKKIVRPEDMPWEMSRQGLLKHLINENMNTRVETVDAYMQILPPGSRSGKHRHLAEECIYVVEGRGYDLHQDSDCEIGDQFEWIISPEVKRFEWEAGDVIYIPPNTVHQHFNADPAQPQGLGAVDHVTGVRSAAQEAVIAGRNQFGKGRLDHANRPWRYQRGTGFS
jgi:quercetin dioxygenase-like cupin family protein